MNRRRCVFIEPQDTLDQYREAKGNKFTSFGVWLSAILCPSNRNLSVLAGTPWKKHTIRHMVESRISR